MAIERKKKLITETRQTIVDTTAVVDVMEKPARFWHMTPWRADKDLGKAYNECFELVPDDNDWVLITDRDIIFLDHTYGKILEWAINKYPDAGILTCTTNRLSIRPQLHENGSLFKEPDIRVHAEQAKKDAKQKKYRVTGLDRPIAGLFMAIKKSTWKQVKFAEGMGALNVDVDYSRRMMESGRKIYRLDGIYVFHYYRMLEGKNYKEHLL